MTDKDSVIKNGKALMKLFRLVRRWKVAGLISDEGYQEFLDVWCELLYEETE